MDNEKEIKELAKNFCPNAGRGCKHCVHNNSFNAMSDKIRSCYFLIGSSNAIEAGYRKADEVRKETAKEMKQTIKDIIRYALRNKGNTSIPHFNAEAVFFEKIDKEIDRAFKQDYGVKVQDENNT